MRDIALFAHSFLDRETTAKVAWLVVDSFDRGKDLAREIHKLRVGEFASTTIAFDALPTYAANSTSGALVFVLVDNQDTKDTPHYDTALVTMQDSGSHGDLMYRNLTRVEQQEASEKLGEHKLTEAMNFTADGARDFTHSMVRAPDVILLDVAEPDWSKLTGYVGGHTRLMMTDRVTSQPPLKSA